MPRMTSHRTGCDCFNQTYTGAGDHTGCADSATYTVCRYVLMDECVRYADYDHAVNSRFSGVKEAVVFPCMTLKKDCVTGDTWTSRWVGDPNSTNPSEWIYDSPWIGVFGPDGGDSGRVFSGTQPVYFDENPSELYNRTCAEFINRYYENTTNIFSAYHTSPCACHWGPEPADDSVYDDGPQEKCGITPINCNRKWTLTITSQTTATLELNTLGGLVAQYDCAEFDPSGRSTFKLTRADAGLFLNPCLCLAALRTPNDYLSDGDGIGPRELCNEQPCNCCFDFNTNCSLPFFVQICEDDPVEVTLTPWWEGSEPTLEDTYPGVTFPTTVKCKAFVGSVDISAYNCDGYGDTILFVVWCDGENEGDSWRVEPYCYDNLAGWVSQGQATVSQTCTCWGITFTFSFSAECLCCVTTGCCDCAGLPASVTASWSSSTGESGSATLSLSGCAYTGTITTAPSGDLLDITVDFNTCEACISCNGSLLRCANAAEFITNSCNPVDVEATFNGIIAGCPNGVLDTGTLTVVE